MIWADLHLHSNFSDGADPPEEVVARAAELGISAAMLTDHDTLEGCDAFARAAAAAGIDTLRGVEVSTLFEGREVHVVCVGPGGEDGALQALLARLQAGRWERVREILVRLAAAEIALTIEEVTAQSQVGVPGRMHIANALREQGRVRTTQDAFERYLNFGRPAYVRKQLVPVEEAVEAIHAAGALALVAHPGLGKNLRKMLPRLLALPFDGIEAYHISHSVQRTQTLLALAKERGLAVGGGSDCHGTIKGRSPEMGKVKVPRAVFDALRERLGAA